jgi:hypothetical protein
MQSFKRLLRSHRIVHDGTFSNLQAEGCWRHAMALQNFLIEQIARRNIYRYLGLHACRSEFAAKRGGAVQHPARENADESAFFGKGDEAVGE